MSAALPPDDAGLGVPVRRGRAWLLTVPSSDGVAVEVGYSDAYRSLFAQVFDVVDAEADEPRWSLGFDALGEFPDVVGLVAAAARCDCEGFDLTALAAALRRVDAVARPGCSSAV